METSLPTRQLPGSMLVYQRDLMGFDGIYGGLMGFNGDLLVILPIH